jgi:hypothetical protein
VYTCSLGIKAQSVVANGTFYHGGDSGLLSNSLGKCELYLNPVLATYKMKMISLCLQFTVVPVKQWCLVDEGASSSSSIPGNGARKLAAACG